MRLRTPVTFFCTAVVIVLIGSAASAQVQSSSSPSELTPLAGPLLLFSAESPLSGHELWRSDGMPSGTRLVKDINPGPSCDPVRENMVLCPGSSNPSGLTSINGTVFFVTRYPESDLTVSSELWKSDGTAEGTILLKHFPWYLTPDSQTFTNVNGSLFFAAGGYQNLWKSDGTPEGTIGFAHADSPGNFTDVNGTLFFTARTGSALWRSDGTVAGTVPLLEMASLPAKSLRELTDVNGTLFFVSGNHDPWAIARGQIWKSDGTPEGTVLIKDGVTDGSWSQPPHDLTSADGTVFFTGTDPANGSELWKTDGTSQGTVLVKGINPGSNSSNPWPLGSLNGALLFAADDGSGYGSALWRSDGTEEGTILVKRIVAQSKLTRVNGIAFFAAYDFLYGGELWRSDGSSVGTSIVADINPEFYYYGGESSWPHEFVNVNGALFFTADDGAHGEELWKSDGTGYGTEMVDDIAPLGDARSLVRSVPAPEVTELPACGGPLSTAYLRYDQQTPDQTRGSCSFSYLGGPLRVEGALIGSGIGFWVFPFLTPYIVTPSVSVTIYGPSGQRIVGCGGQRYCTASSDPPETLNVGDTLRCVAQGDTYTAFAAGSAGTFACSAGG